MKILYRISNCGKQTQRPHYVYDRNIMFLHFLDIFKDHDIYVFADNVSDETYTFLMNNYDNSKIFRISLGNGKSFMHIVDYAINNFNIDDKIYFAEDDYIYKKNAPSIIEEGLTIADYSSGYDHPDKYINYNEGGPNPFIEHGGELTRVLITNNSHWKLTNSCCMTFASTIKTIKEDYNIFQDGCCHSAPGDFGIFCNLIKSKNKKLVSCIPSVSTHGENAWLAKFVNWDDEMKKSMGDLIQM